MKHIPMRLCVSCRNKFPKRELLRVVHTPGGEVMLDDTGKLPGRGAYVCKNSDCIAQALSKGKFERSLKSAVDVCVKEQLANKR